MGVAQVDAHHRRAQAPDSGNTRSAHRALRIAQTRCGQLPDPRIARDRRHLVAAAGFAGQSAWRMVVRAQRQGAEISCNRGSSMSAPDESTVDVVRKATRELARSFGYEYWRRKDK